MVDGIIIFSDFKNYGKILVGVGQMEALGHTKTGKQAMEIQGLLLVVPSLTLGL